MEKKLRNIIRLTFFMLRRSVSKSKLMLDLHHMMMKGGKITGKAISNLIMHHHHNHFYSTLTCRSLDPHLSVISPAKEYEFSCSSSPAYPFNLSKRKSHYHHHHHARYAHAPPKDYDDAETVCAVKAVLDMLGGVDAAEPPSPVAGFWTSPVVDRQLRVTDSPFPLKDGGEDCHVDEAAAEFIERFYKELRVQNRIDAREAAHNFG